MRTVRTYLTRSAIAACALAGPLLATVLPVAAQNEVNVSEQWCGGDCSEGHNDTQCICQRDASCTAPGCWHWCREVPCCQLEARLTWCEYDAYACESRQGDATFGCGEDGWGYCYLWGRAICTVYFDQGETGCWGYVNYQVPTMFMANTDPGSQCTGTNETTMWYRPWEWPAAFNDCTLAEQTPWDDPHYGVVCD